MNCPTGWKQTRLGDVLTLINGRAYKKTELLNQGTPVLRIQNLNGGDRWYYSDLTLPEKKYCEDGDLLFAWSASFGPYIWRGPKSIYHYHIWKIELSQELDKGFAYYLLQNITEAVKAAGRGISMVHMTKSGMEDWMVSIPPLEEQKRIAGILDQADALRRLRTRALDKLNTLGQAIFQEMFGDVVENKNGWEKQRLGEVFDLKHGFAFKSENFVPEGTYVLLTPGNFFEQGGFKDRGERQKYHNEPVPSDYILEHGDILIAMTEQAPGLLGSPLIVPEGRKFLHNQRLGKVLKKREVESAFIFGLMNTAAIRARIQKDSTGLKVKHTSPSKIGNIEIGMPPIGLQKQYSNVLQAIECKASLLAEAVVMSGALWESLQHRAFRGDL